MRSKIEMPPCSTCGNLCNNAIQLYEAYQIVSPGLKVKSMGLWCAMKERYYILTIPEAEKPCR